MQNANFSSVIIIIIIFFFGKAFIKKTLRKFSSEKQQIAYSAAKEVHRENSLCFFLSFFNKVIYEVKILEYLLRIHRKD